MAYMMFQHFLTWLKFEHLFNNSNELLIYFQVKSLRLPDYLDRLKNAYIIHNYLPIWQHYVWHFSDKLGFKSWATQYTQKRYF